VASRLADRQRELLTSPRAHATLIAVGACGLLAFLPPPEQRNPVVLACLALAAVALALLSVRLPGAAAPLYLDPLILVPAWVLGGAWLAAALALLARGTAIVTRVPVRLRPDWQVAASLAGVSLGGSLGIWTSLLVPDDEAGRLASAGAFALGLWLGQTGVEWLSPWRHDLAATWLSTLLNSLVLFPPAYFLADIGLRDDKVPFAISLGLAIGLVILVRALTNSENRTAELEEQAATTADDRHRLELIVDHAPEAIFGMDPEGGLLWLNRTATDWLGDQAEAAVGQPANLAVPLRDGAGNPLDHRALLGRARTAGLPIHQEGLLESAPGAPERVLASYSVIREADSDGLGVVLLRDASLVGETLREQEELAVQLSHELRAPLTTILGYAQLISNPNATSLQPDAQTEFARRISESGDYMLRLVNNLLDLGRVSRDEAEAPPLQPVDVVGLSRDTVEAVRQQANQKGQELRFDSALDSLVVQSSDLALRQILNNLLANAIKYTPPSGQVRLELAASEREIVWQVVDNGIGLSPDEQRRLFTKFFRSQRPEARLIKGTGLGLALTRALIERLGGTIEVQSEIDRGTTFTVRLPRAA
jgi:signal transduction histidine kinase